MPSIVALVLPLLALLAAPASATYSATPDGPQESAPGGFAITFVVLLVSATVFALVWRARSKKREGR